jgi:hypothetical protein
MAQNEMEENNNLHIGEEEMKKNILHRYLPNCATKK